MQDRGGDQGHDEPDREHLHEGDGDVEERVGVERREAGHLRGRLPDGGLALARRPHLRKGIIGREHSEGRSSIRRRYTTDTLSVTGHFEDGTVSLPSLQAQRI